MMAIVCDNERCRYRKAVFCGLEYSILNQFGQCSVWFNKQGGLRPVPEYMYDRQPFKKETPEDEKQKEENSEKCDIQIEKTSEGKEE